MSFNKGDYSDIAVVERLEFLDEWCEKHGCTVRLGIDSDGKRLAWTWAPLISGAGVSFGDAIVELAKKLQAKT